MTLKNSNCEPPRPDSIRGYNVLINRIEEGIIRIPKFQRGFVWSIEATAKLLDSILKGYPIGSFILWETDKRVTDAKEIGGLILRPPHDGEKISYVLDGQQRIASLFVAYRGEKIRREGEKKETDYGSIAIDLEAHQEEDEPIVVVNPNSNRRVSLSDVLNYDYPKGKEIENEFGSEKAKLVEGYKEAFHAYSFSTVVFNKSDINSAIDVFTRINTGGKKLTLFEIMSAKTYDERQRFDMQKKWKKFIGEVKKSNYGSISSSLVLNLLALTLGDGETKECKRQVTLDLDKQKIIDSWERVTSALKESIIYCKQDLLIPVSQLLPYDALLVPLAYFFYHKERHKMSSQQSKQMQQLFWRTALSHRYSGASETRLAQDIRNVVDRILEGNCEEPPKYDYRVVIEPQDLIERAASSDSFCKAVLCLLASREPKSFCDGSKINLGDNALKSSNLKNCHHFFPKAHLKRKGISNANSLMNITLISDRDNKKRIRDKAPSVYIGEFQQNGDTTIEEALETHFISRDGFGIDEDDYNAFLQARADRICKALRAKIEEAGGE